MRAGGAQFGYDPDAMDRVIEAYKKDVDRTLIRENLRLTLDQRILNLIELQKFALEARRAGLAARTSR
jgi:hypothetical protein